MNCPFCGKEMARGFLGNVLRSGAGEVLYFAPEEHTDGKAFVTKRGAEKAGGVTFKPAPSIFDDFPTYSYYCRECGKIVVDLKGNG